MHASASSLIGELEDALSTGLSETRVSVLRRVTDLFTASADGVSDDQVELFDEVLGRLALDIENQARVELATRLAKIANAPARIVNTLARDEDIQVAGPVLRYSDRLFEDTILETAKERGQDHLFAISQRKTLSEAVTDVLVTRGDQHVVRTVAGNKGACFSTFGFGELVRKSESDEVLAVRVASRHDIPVEAFRRLVSMASETVLNKLATYSPALKSQIQDVISNIVEQVAAEVGAPIRDYGPAMSKISLLHAEGRLREAELAAFARAEKFEEMVVALSLLCHLSVDTVERLLVSDQYDPLLILAKSSEFLWSTARVILVCGRQGKISPNELDLAEQNYKRLNTVTAQRVLRFYQVRQAVSKPKPN